MSMLEGVLSAYCLTRLQSASWNSRCCWSWYQSDSLNWQDVVVGKPLPCLQGSHSTWKTLKTWNFVIYFSRPEKCIKFAQKLGKSWNFNSKPGKNPLKLVNSVFYDSLFKMSLTKNRSFTCLSYLHYQNRHCDFEAKLTCHFIPFTWL